MVEILFVWTGDTVMRDSRNVYVRQSKRLCDTVEKFMLDSDYVGKEKRS